MSKWWDSQMGMAGQGLFSDPATAVQVATLPQDLLQANAADQANQAIEQQTVDARGGFMQSIMSGLQQAGHGLDGALSNIPGWGVTKDVAKAAWWPIDKVASGMNWLYSNAISRPLSTALLVGGKADIYGPGQFFSGDAWSDAFHHAQHESPGQAFTNETLMTYRDLSKEVGAQNDTDEYTPQQKQQLERFLYDSKYWRNREGWMYTLGSGSVDFGFNTTLDPGGKILKAGKLLTASSRSVQLAADEMKVSKPLTFWATPADATASGKMISFFDWAQNKTPYQIAQHPIWGVGLRKNPFAEQYSQVLANTPRDTMPLVMRFAAGDSAAMNELAQKSQSLTIQMGDMADNRVLVAGHDWDPHVLDHFTQAAEQGEEAAPYMGNQIVKPPYPRPEEPGARQTGWDLRWGNLANSSSVYEDAAKSITKNVGLKPMGEAENTNFADLLKAESWQASKLSNADTVIGSLQQQESWLGSVLGNNLGRDVEDIRPADSSLFGQLKSLYRMGPLAALDANKAADRAIANQVADRYGRALTAGGFASRLIQKGFYTIPLRVWQAFGDRVPDGFVDHNDPGATDKVLDMLKQVPGLGADTRLGMVNAYSSAADKVAKSQALDDIHTAVINHMVSGLNNLSPELSDFINDTIKQGWQSTMSKMTGRFNPSQRFTAATDDSGRYLDYIEDGEGHSISPLAKTQLNIMDPLLDVKQLGRILSRGSGYFQSLNKFGGNVRDFSTDVADSINGLWKTGTLLRGAYALRAPSEEMAASAVKFGILSSVMDLGRGGANFFANRQQTVKAIFGQGGVSIDDPDALAAAVKNGWRIENIKVNKAWPLVISRLNSERDALNGVQSKISDTEKQLAGKLSTADRRDLNDRKSILQEMAQDHQDTINEHTYYANAILAAAEDSSGRRLGEGTFNYKGIEVPQAFNKQWEGVIPRDQITSDEAMASLFARQESIDMRRIIKTGSWTTITPDQPHYMDSWLNALNFQFKQDPLFNKVMEDPTLNLARRWLATPAGRMHLSQLTLQARNPDNLLNSIKATLDQYLPEATGLRSKLVDGKNVTEADLRGAIAQADFPTVHGEEVKALTSGNSATRMIDDIVAKGWKNLGQIPIDTMSWHPTYLRAHNARMRDLIDQHLQYMEDTGGDTSSIPPEDLNAMMGTADKLARSDMRQIVYDPERTTATQSLRFITPFLAAHVNALERWFGLIAEKPQLLNTASKIYNAPVAANLVTDRQGNLVDESGYANTIGPDGKLVSRDFVPMQDRILQLKIPGITRNVKGLGQISGGSIPIPITTLNTIMPGDPWWNPGTGPLVQVAASKIAEQSPATGDFLQYMKILPNGPGNMTDAMLPKYLKDLWTGYQGDDPSNTKFQQTALEEWQRQQADYANGGPAPDMNKVISNARQFYMLKALTDFMSPVSTQVTPLTGTPYQFFVDQYRTLQKVDPKNAASKFLATYGPDYYAFTSALNTSMGIASTAPAVQTAKMYKDILAQHPDMAQFIVGPYGKGNFSQSANYWLENNAIGGKFPKQTGTVYDAIDNNQKDLGWALYKQYAGLVDAALFRSGFRSYQDNGAQQFAEAKNAVVSFLAQQYPAWDKDFNTTDKDQVPSRIEAFQQLVNDPRLANDPLRSDIPMLKTYLAVRQKFQDELATRSSQNLTSSSNQDLALAWAQAQMAMVQQDTQFNDVFNRYLGQDKLQQAPENVQAKQRAISTKPTGRRR